jgi:mannan endo-1,4-beta-mannosidase
VNRALNRPATASSTESASYPASYAVDGNTATRWSSAFADPQWLQIDLGSSYAINRVRLNWEAAYANAYSIQVSNDATNWTSIYSRTSGAGGINDLTVSGTGRYVRMYGTTRATAYGYSLWEFEVYGNPVNGPTPTPAPTRTAAPTATPTAAPTNGSISTTAWYSIVNRNSAKCVDARAAATANGTAIQQYTCNNSNAQQFQFGNANTGYYRVGNRSNVNQVLDVTGVSTADGALIQLWLYGGGANQQWQAVSEGSGYYHFVSLNSGKCLDVPAASTADSVQLDQYTCNGTAAQSFSLVAH